MCQLWRALIVSTFLVASLTLGAETDEQWKLVLEPAKAALVWKEPLLLKATWTNTGTRSQQLWPDNPILRISDAAGVASERLDYTANFLMNPRTPERSLRLGAGESYTRSFMLALNMDSEFLFPRPGDWSITFKQWAAEPARITVIAPQEVDATFARIVTRWMFRALYDADLCVDDRQSLDALLRRHPDSIYVPWFSLALARAELKKRTHSELLTEARNADLAHVEPYLQAVINHPDAPASFREEALVTLARQQILEAYKVRERDEAGHEWLLLASQQTLQRLAEFKKLGVNAYDGWRMGLQEQLEAALRKEAEMIAREARFASEAEERWQVVLEPARSNLVLKEPLMLKATWTNTGTKLQRLYTRHPRLNVTSPSGDTQKHSFFETLEEQRTDIFARPKVLKPGETHTRSYTIALVPGPALLFPTPGEWSIALHDWASPPARITVTAPTGDDALFSDALTVRLLSLVHGEELKHHEHATLAGMLRRHPRSTYTPYLALAQFRHPPLRMERREMPGKDVERYLRAASDHARSPAPLREEALIALYEAQDYGAARHNSRPHVQQHYFDASRATLKRLETEFPKSEQLEKLKSALR